MPRCIKKNLLAVWLILTLFCLAPSAWRSAVQFGTCSANYHLANRNLAMTIEREVPEASCINGDSDDKIRWTAEIPPIVETRQVR